MLFYGRCITATGFSMAIPFLSLYLHNDLGISMSLVGLILLVSSLVGSMGNIVGGEIADRYGRKRIMSMALAWRSLAFLSIALAIATGQNYLAIAALITFSSFGGCFTQRPAGKAPNDDVLSHCSDVLVDQRLHGKAFITDVCLVEQDKLILIFLDCAFHNARDYLFLLAFFAGFSGSNLGLAFNHFSGDVGF
ncbi:MAG: multidrug resistance protein MdtH [Methanomassiliicoccales archaeon PtaU1.Bin124]|nr:MAG: multidrug resistance protein MdtH [Methanomassiliicoccales archaeon PtaU1.Bin124]